MKVEFECIVCGDSAVARVPEPDGESEDGPLRTLRDCSNCGIETIWIES